MTAIAQDDFYDMRHFLKEISFKTSSPVEFIDITERVKDVCAKGGIRDGLVSVFTTHTTTAIRINERCDRLQKDMLAFFEKTVPAGNYRHDESTVDNRPNARSHLISLLLNSSETIPVADGKLLLGGWQSIFFIELDGPRPERRVTVRIIGE